MSTYANVLIEEREFCVTSDGGDKELIRDLVSGYVGRVKGKVKPDYLATAVLDAITAESATDYYTPFRIGFAGLASYRWEVKIGLRGGVKIKGGRIRI